MVGNDDHVITVRDEIRAVGVYAFLLAQFVDFVRIVVIGRKPRLNFFNPWSFPFVAMRVAVIMVRAIAIAITIGNAPGIVPPVRIGTTIVKASSVAVCLDCKWLAF